MCPFTKSYYSCTPPNASLHIWLLLTYIIYLVPSSLGFKSLIPLIPSHYLILFFSQAYSQIPLSLTLVPYLLLSAHKPPRHKNHSRSFSSFSHHFHTCTRQLIPYILSKSSKVNTQHKIEMLFNFSVALGQPQREQVAKILGIKFCKVSAAHSKSDYSPSDLWFGQSCLGNNNSTYFQVRIIKKK